MTLVLKQCKQNKTKWGNLCGARVFLSRFIFFFFNVTQLNAIFNRIIYKFSNQKKN